MGKILSFESMMNDFMIFIWQNIGKGEINPAVLKGNKKGFLGTLLGNSCAALAAVWPIMVIYKK